MAERRPAERAMCGLTGVVHYRDVGRPVDREVVRAMTASLAHRGPDGEGFWFAPGVGLGHRRLAILDLSDNAHQPMTHAGSELALVYNGEVYNFRELRAVLEARGHRFRSTGDTEVILVGYAEWGRAVVERLSGIFALALWDGRRRELFLARDPVGVKPLFYAVDGDTIRFASEVKAVLTDPGVARDFDLEALDSFFTLSYTPAPATGFRQVRQLLPGHAAVAGPRGFETWRYAGSPFDADPLETGFEEALAGFEERLDRVTRSQMVSDVPVGAFLSGGLDSAAMVRAMKRADRAPVHALCVGFDVPGFDERPRARATASALEVELSEVVASMDASALLPVLSRHLEEPTADSSALPEYLLCRAAAERFKVAIAGDGADELLAGYETYRATRLAAAYRRIPRAVRSRVLAPLAHRVPRGEARYSLHERLTRFVHGAELGPDLDHSAWRIIFTDDLKDRLYTPELRGATRHHRPLEAYAAHIRATPPSRHRLDALLRADFEFYLPNDMLVKVDRMSMAHGLEVRVPFLDLDLVRYCARLPAGFKLHRGRVRKHILRESLRPSLPREVLRAPKAGFNVPLAAWLRGPLRALLFDSVGSVRSELAAFLDVGEIEVMAEDHRRMRANHGYVLFTVLMFSLWLHNAAHAWKVPGRAAGAASLPRGAGSPD